mgnify:CR=1 FL=1
MGFTMLLRGGIAPLIGAFAARLPALDLIGIEDALPTVLRTLGLAQGRRLLYGVEFVLRAQALGIIALVK